MQAAEAKARRTWQVNNRSLGRTFECYKREVWDLSSVNERYGILKMVKDEYRKRYRKERDEPN